MADIEVVRHREEPWTEARVRLKILASRNQAQPCFLQQILRDGTVLRHPREETIAGS